MDWNDPAARAALIEAVGHVEYNRLFKAHRKTSVVATVNGHAIRPVSSRFGTLFQVGDTGTAFASLALAKAHALTLPKGDGK